VSTVSRNIDRFDVTFDDPNLVANSGLILVGTLPIIPWVSAPSTSSGASRALVYAVSSSARKPI